MTEFLAPPYILLRGVSLALVLTLPVVFCKWSAGSMCVFSLHNPIRLDSSNFYIMHIMLQLKKIFFLA